MKIVTTPNVKSNSTANESMIYTASHTAAPYAESEQNET